MSDVSVDSSAAPILRFDRVSKRFGGTLAVDGVSLDLFRGEIMALLGENGAGKSTMIKMLANLFSADGGRRPNGRKRVCRPVYPGKSVCESRRDRFCAAMRLVLQHMLRGRT